MDYLLCMILAWRQWLAARVTTSRFCSGRMAQMIEHPVWLAAFSEQNDRHDIAEGDEELLLKGSSR